MLLINGTMSTVSSSENGYLSNNCKKAIFSSKSRLSSYLQSLRPWSFSASMTPVALGCTLAYKTTDTFSFLILIISALTALCVHAAGNLVNTYFDYMKGIDSKKSDDRTLVDEILTPQQVVHLGALFYCFGCVGFLALVYLSPVKMEHLALVYFGGLSSSFLYTGGIGLKYIALGDLLVLVTFGPVTVLFAYMSQTGMFEMTPLLYALPLALNTEAILHSNNTRDMDTDRRAGAVTVAILLGQTGSYILFAFLLFIPFTVLAVLGINCSLWFFLPLITLPNAFRIERMFRENNLCSVPRKTAKLNLVLGLLYTIACLATPSKNLPGIK